MTNPRPESGLIETGLFESADERLIDPEGLTFSTENVTMFRVYPELPAEPTREQWMKLAETSPGLEFWNRPEEDQYTSNDGEPI
jgi:hypothetical protein